MVLQSHKITHRQNGGHFDANAVKNINYSDMPMVHWSLELLLRIAVCS